MIPDSPLRHAELAELRHNLRTPVNHVLGYTEMLIEDANDAHDDEALDALRHVHSAARAVLSDVNRSLGNRETVERDELRELYEKLQPRVERIRGCADSLLASPDRDDWNADLERIKAAGAAILRTLTERGGGDVQPSQEPDVPVRRQTAANGARVLVVDDNATNRNMLSRRLERQGYVVQEARHGSEALDRVATEEFELVLLDIMMPVMDGFEVLARMKADRRMRSIPVIVISALDEVDSVVRAIEMGAEDYLFKPFDPVLLRARIGALLEQKRLRQELLVQEKLASLGALTAGVAHEIKNPLNFVINFAQLGEELAAEQKERVEKLAGKLEQEELKVLLEIAEDLVDNLAKIREHGARADRIIASMLGHSRGQKGQRQSIDLNALVREFVNLAFHGMRAQDHNFQATIETDFDNAVGTVSVIPQDLSRVFLNIASNAFYAMRRKAQQGIAGYRPELRVFTKTVAQGVELHFRDNGTGIPKDMRDRIFEPFFTTKPAGEGTGLGLSISREIVVQEHQGEMRVESQEGDYTEFIITLPRSAAVPA